MALGTDPRGASSVLFGVPIFLFSFLKDQRHHFPFIGFCSYTVIGYISCRSKYLILLWMNQSYWVVVLFTQSVYTVCIGYTFRKFGRFFQIYLSQEYIFSFEKRINTFALRGVSIKGPLNIVCSQKCLQTYTSIIL